VARKKQSSRYDGRWIMFLVLSVMLVLTMILAYFPSILPTK
jgi:hypothetical protein